MPKILTRKLIVNVLSEGVPHGVDFDSVNDVLLAVAGVKSTHSLRMWSLTTSEMYLSVHVVIGKTCAHSNASPKMAV